MERLPLSGSGPDSAFAASIDVVVTDDMAACGPADPLVFWAGNAVVVALAWRGSFSLDGSGDHTLATTPAGLEVTVGNGGVGFGREPTLNLTWQDRDLVYSLDAEGVELDVLLDLVDSIVVTG